MQQGWFLPPQVPQLPLAAQVPAPLHDWPVPMQAGRPPLTEQHPAAHRLPGQQGVPVWPHLWQVAVDAPGMTAQTAVESVQV